MNIPDISGQGGAEELFPIERLFNSYYTKLCYFAWKLLNDKSAAQDVAQDSFIKYWDRRRDFTSEAAIKTFLYITVKNACLNRVRHSEVKRRFAETQLSQPVEEEKVVEHIIRTEVLGEIHQAIENLPPGCRRVLKLAYFEGLKNDEIAQALNVSVNTVKTQKARALQLLKLNLDIGTYLFLLLLLRHG